MPLERGLRAEVTTKVTSGDTATELGSGDVPVMGTPRLVALCEQATVAALADHLEPGHTTVGFRIEIEHLAATGVGGTVRAEATLEKVEGKRLTFKVSAHDSADVLVGVGHVTRVIVERERFLERIG